MFPLCSHADRDPEGRPVGRLARACALHRRKVDNTHSTAKCHYRAELDLETLVWTRGPHMSLAGLNDRMMCPRCGNRRVNLIFEPPTIAGRAGG